MNGVRAQIFLSIAVTLVGTVVAYFLLRQPPLIGMDDANITQVYGRNIADGFGYVFTVGFERVEGSTSILWTLINAAAFSISPRPEPLLLGLCFVLAAGTIFLAVRVYALLASKMGSGAADAFFLLYAFLLGIFGFYAWNVLSLMDWALWTFLFNALVLALARRIDGSISLHRSLIWIGLLAVLMGLSRPEAMALVPFLLVLGAVGEWRLNCPPRTTVLVFGVGVACSAITTVALVIFRLAYFGVPFPNTYYAKVSNSPVDNLRNGMEYFADLNIFGPYADILVLAALVCFVVAVWRGFLKRESGESRKFYRILFVVMSATMVVLGLPLLTGGDHFGSFRLYQPAYPLLFLPVFLVLMTPPIRQPVFGEPYRRAKAVLIAVVCGVYLAVSGAYFYKTSFLKREFEAAYRGRDVGEMLNALAKNTAKLHVGVIAAGGVAEAYKGRIVDLMGLNWPKMAHATGRRTGIRGHSAFQASVFWNEPPELVLPGMSKAMPKHISVRSFDDRALAGLIRSTRFREEYEPVAIPLSGAFLVAYARRDWIKAYAKTASIHTIGWNRVEF